MTKVIIRAFVPLAFVIFTTLYVGQICINWQFQSIKPQTFIHNWTFSNLKIIVYRNNITVNIKWKL